MRYAILSDIHANLEALTAALEDLSTQRVDRYACLGDVVGYGADPVACLTRLAQLDVVTVAGNHDWGCLGKLDATWFNAAARQALAWTRDQLSFAELDVLRRWPLIQTLDALTLVHASLHRPERFEYVVDVAQAIDTLRACRTAYCGIGHTHVPWCVEYDAAEHVLRRVLLIPSDLDLVQLSGDGRSRFLLNPGSVGQPRDGDPRASVAILDTEARTFAIRRVRYDVDTAQRKIREARLPGLLADRLALGR